VSSIHGIEAASFGQIAPFSGGFVGRPAVAEGLQVPAPAGDELVAPYNVVSAGYFRTLGLPLRGRDFDATDDEDAPKVMVVNETLARRLWPAGDAIGKRLYLPLRAPGPLYTVIGVVPDGKYLSPVETQHPFMYLPLSQGFRPRLTLHVRTAADPASFAPQVRAALREAAPDLPAYSAVTLDGHLRQSLARERLLARLLSLFGLVALAIAAVGIYGVLAYAVARRTQELGLRMALGARPADIIRLVTAQSATLVGIGLAAGLAASLLLTRLLTSFLFGITATDPIAFAAATLVLVIVALAATAVPALRAARVDPLSALRTD
jgi:predicted permease